jgi:DNA-binding NarL/FixJ family response regulator
MGPIKVLLVDDHALLRESLRGRLSQEHAIGVVGVAANADEGLELARELQPDVVLMDIRMPGVDCFAAASRLRTVCPQARVVFLTAYAHDHYIEAALKAGAVGFLTKCEPPERVVAAVRAAAIGRTSYSDDVRARLAVEQDRPQLANAISARASTLTPREIETLRYVARGLSKGNIAKLMHVSPRTVDRHTENLMHKLRIHDRLLLARYAIREGLIEP